MEIDIDRKEQGTILKFSYRGRKHKVLVADAKDRYYGMIPLEEWKPNANDLGSFYKRYDEILSEDYLPDVTPGSIIKSDLPGFVIPDVITTAVIMACIDEINELDPTAKEYNENCMNSGDGMEIIVSFTSTSSQKKNYFFAFYNGVRYCFCDRSNIGLIMPVKFL